MPYRQNNYEFTIDSSFQPFTMQEMLVPFSAYKDAYEKTEEAYQNLSDKADKFKYLSETLPEDSKARSIYEGYANELHKQADDLARNGLGMGNRRALTSLKRRYQGEIGRLAEADIAMQKEKELRRQLSAKDSSMLYAIDNLDIDSFLDNKTPNLYNISGTELYTRGAAAGKAASSRVYSAGDEGSTLGGYYRKWVEKNGYSKESMDAFRANASAIPELQQAADAILAERGVNENLTGSNLERARQSVINGIIDGAVYAEKVSPVRDPGVMSAQEKDASARGWAGLALEQQKLNLEKQKAAVAAMAAGVGNGNGQLGLNFDVRNVRTDVDIAAQQQSKKNWDEYKKYFYKDKNGYWRMTQAGQQEYLKPTRQVYAPAYGGTNGMFKVPSFKEFVDKLGISEMAKGRPGPGQSHVVDSFIKFKDNDYDATRSTEYVRRIDPSDYGNVLSIMAEVSDEGKLTPWKREKNNGSYNWSPSKDKVDIEKLSSSDIQGAATIYGQHGNFIEVSLKGGKKVAIPLSQVSPTTNDIVTGNINDALALQARMDAGDSYVTLSDGSTSPILLETVNALNRAGDQFSSGLGSTRTKENEVVQGLYGRR